MASDEFFIGLDFGSYYIKASAITGRNGDIVFSSYGESIGLEDGRVKDSVQLLTAIKSVLRQLEIKIGTRITQAFVSIDTAFTRQEANRGTVSVSGDLVQEKDMVAAIKNSMQIALGSNEKIIDVLVGDYKVDGVSFANPQGVAGSLLDVTTQSIVADEDFLKDLALVLKSCDVKILGTGVSVHGMANLMLTRSQRTSGVLMVDSGHKKTDVVVMKNNRIVSSKTIPLGGRNITKDLSIVLKISMNEAESLKQEFGSGKMLKSHPKFELVRDIVTARMDEILKKVHDIFIESPGHEEVKHALVFGGGLCGFKNIQQMVAEFVPMPTNYVTSDIIKSDDIFTLNATGAAYNMLHDLQSGLIAAQWDEEERVTTPKQKEEPVVEQSSEYYSVFDKIRHRAKGRDIEAIDYEEEFEDTEPFQEEEVSKKQFGKKEEKLSVRLKKLFGLE